MATKYRRQKDGCFQAKVWDGTYTADNLKHYITLYSTKSSTDLENKVNKFKDSVKEGNIKITSDILFCDYAWVWLKTYKAVRERAFVLIAFGCGLRRGEILALTIFDISLERAELTVNKSLAFDGNNPLPQRYKVHKWGAYHSHSSIFKNIPGKLHT